MSFPPAPADKAGTGPESHRRTCSVESGIGTDNTLVGDDEPMLYASAKLVELDHVLPSRTPRAASLSDLAATQGRVTPETALGPPTCGTTTNDVQGSSTAAAPNTVSSFTATALAVADNTARNPPGPDEAIKTVDKDSTHLASTAFARIEEDFADFVACAPALPSPAIARTGSVVTVAVPGVPVPIPIDWLLRPGEASQPRAIRSAGRALAAIRGGRQSRRALIDWAAVASDPKAGAVPPPSAAALRHLGAVQQPQSPMQAGYIRLSNMVRLEPGCWVDPNSPAEQRLRDETDEIRAKVARLIEGAGRPASGTRLKSSRASKAEIAAAVREAELADLEAYKFEHERNAHS